jgi:hypothetical protein
MLIMRNPKGVVFNPSRKLLDFDRRHQNSSYPHMRRAMSFSSAPTALA